MMAHTITANSGTDGKCGVESKVVVAAHEVTNHHVRMDYWRYQKPGSLNNYPKMVDTGNMEDVPDRKEPDSRVEKFGIDIPLDTVIRLAQVLLSDVQRKSIVDRHETRFSYDGGSDSSYMRRRQALIGDYLVAYDRCHPGRGPKGYEVSVEDHVAHNHHYHSLQSL